MPKRRGKKHRSRPQRTAHPFARALARAAIFVGGALAVLVLFEVLGFDMSAFAEPGRLKNPLTMFIALMFSIGLTAVGGAALGFRFVPAGRVLRTARLPASGAVFGLLAYLLFVPTLQLLGVYLGAIAYVAAAAAVAFVTARI